MSIIVGIDGSDDYSLPTPGRRESYHATFKESFVSRICREKGPNIKYIEGPLTFGGGLLNAIDEGYNFIINKRFKEGVNEPVLLTGHSRGGIGVVAIANRLNNPVIPGWNQLDRPRAVRVKAMLLFDPVDMHIVVNTRRITNNVEHVLDLRRSAFSGSRPEFIYVEWTAKPPGYIKHDLYHCTHAGMGGTLWPLPRRYHPEIVELGRVRPRRPIPEHIVRQEFIREERYFPFPDNVTRVTHAQDEQESIKVWDDAQKFISRHGFL